MIKWANWKPERANLTPMMINLTPEKADFKPQRADLFLACLLYADDMCLIAPSRGAM